MSRFYLLTLGILGVWRVTSMLNAEDGPGRIFVRIRKLAGNGFWGSLLDCFYCLSVWTAAAFACAIADSWSERLLLWPALSGAAILLERATKPAPAVYFEDPERKDP